MHNNEELIREIETHLRKITRQMIHIDTEEETIQYLINSFIEEINCHFIIVVLVENKKLIPKAWGGDVGELVTLFPLQINNKTERFLLHSLKDKDTNHFTDCPIVEGLKCASIKRWFTVPLVHGERKYGFCIAGYYSDVPLFEMHHIFDEFGKDVAVAVSVVREKERNMERLEDTDWIKRFSIDKTLEENAKQFMVLASKGLHAHAACFYVLDEKNNCFTLIYPVYGEVKFPEKIIIKDKNTLKNYFPHLDHVGAKKLTMPIVIDLKVVGVLHIERDAKAAAFTTSDRRMLRLIADYIAIVQENRQMLMTEKQQRERLQRLLDYQQALVKQTVIEDDFKGIANILAEVFDCTIFLLDRFYRVITLHVHPEDKIKFKQISYPAKENFIEYLDSLGYMYTSWVISGVNSHLGYLVLGRDYITLDDFDILSVNIARNICSIQFMKQKLVYDTNEQAKETMMTKLFVEQIDSKNAIIQYANLFQWDIFASHRVTTLSFELEEETNYNLLQVNMFKQYLWDYIKEVLRNYFPKVLTAMYEENYILIVPSEVVGKQDGVFWKELYSLLKEAVAQSDIESDIFLGIGNETMGIESYYTSYRQSVQALNVVKSRFRQQGYALFEDLGSYTILDLLPYQDIHLFMQNQLGKLIHYSKENNIDLVKTLRVYLQNNGNAKSTAKELYMHRSSLLYRLERIEKILNVDLNNFETRFDLMMAFKLLDMYGKVEK